MSPYSNKKYVYESLFILAALFCSLEGLTQNPFIRDQFTADPSARVFNNKIYVYPSHDILAVEGKGRVGWFCMEDYHVFSSANLTDWVDHGVIVKQNEVPWVKKDSYNMWAPDCIFKNGTYYFYFPATPKDTTGIGRGFTIGVATAEHPEGPFTPQAEPIKNVRGIDPNVFTDKNGDSYLYWSAGHIFGAKLKDNMLELDSEVKILSDLPTKGLKEGPYVFERNGVYYLTYPHVEKKIERLEYAIGDNPLGPFKVTGVIMDESPTGCWTNHHSIIQFKDQWYLFYHHNDYSPKFDKNRSVRMDSLFFNTDGAIRKVIPTLRGVGPTASAQQIQIDRFSALSSSGVSVDFIDSTNTFKGWKAEFSNAGGWLRYNRVDFGKEKIKRVNVMAQSSEGSVLHLRTPGKNGMLLAEINIAPGKKEWRVTQARLLKVKQGVSDIVIELKKGDAQVDWISFE